ncbi:MAG TPA: class I SAM-dependent methyltransferase [Steroidobacteraceae bacterium]|nr:class I SAM-dependent methyltransferase [Steroidobacteraceae bacterium]
MSTLIVATIISTASMIAVAVLILNRKLRRLRSMLRRQERHVWEAHNIFRVLQGGAPLPVPGGWAASTDLLGEALRTVTARSPRLVVELGSGLSTLVIAAALRSSGSGRLISIDAEESYAALTRAQLEQHGLQQWAQVRVAALKPLEFEGVTRPWYDTAVLDDLAAIDLLLVDGPPTLLRADIRYPSLPFFWRRLTAGAVVLLDDAARAAERSIAKRWQQSFPQARFDYLRYEKGALRVTLPH